MTRHKPLALAIPNRVARRLARASRNVAIITKRRPKRSTTTYFSPLSSNGPYRARPA